MENLSMAEHQIVHLSKSQLLATMNERLSLCLYDFKRSIREINFEKTFGQDDFSNLKSLGLNKSHFLNKKMCFKLFCVLFFKK